jgi:UDP-glucose 4-epimerase
MNSGKTKVLITGGFGALGMNLIDSLKQSDSFEIYVIDNLSSGVANIRTDVSFSYLDIGNKEKVDSFFGKFHPEIIFHLAAHFANQNSVYHPVSDVTTNVLGLINLFEAQRNNSALKKIIYAGSSCVYGSLEIMNEDNSVYPYETPYAINKYVGELYCKFYSEIHQLPVVCARIFNSFGPGELPGEYRNVIPNFIKKALKGEDIIITGTGNETRDFTYVSDTVGLLIKLADSTFTNAEIFNGGTGTKTTIKYIAETIVRITESKSKIVYSTARSWDHVINRCSDISKSKAKLGYSPKTNFEEGLLKTVKWIQSNKAFWDI